MGGSYLSSNRITLRDQDLPDPYSFACRISQGTHSMYNCVMHNVMHIVMHNVMRIVMHNVMHNVMHIVMHSVTHNVMHNLMHSVLHERRLRMHNWQYAYCNA